MSGKIVGSVRGQVLHLIYPPLVEGTVDYLTAEFSFSGDWDGLSKWAHFKQGSTIYDVPLTNDAITEDQHLNLSAGTWDVYLHGSGDNRRITTTTVRMKVLPYLDEDGEPLPEVPLTFAEVLDQRSQRIQAVAYAVEAGESARKEAERSRELSEFARVQAEAERTGAEAGRASAETERASAETARKNAEQTRVSAENSRSSAEDIRKQNEEARQAAEAIREQNEEARVEAEKNRKDGITPHIGDNGNWYLGDTDTGKPSRGETGAGMDITGATVDQIAKITAVDDTGKPTAWEAVDMPSGGGSAVELDTTLTQSGKAADAKAVGDALAEKQDSGNYVKSVNGTTPDASGNVTVETGGASDYAELTNKPKINGVELSGDKTSADYGIGNPTDEQVASSVEAWLDAHPEATTTVADGSINPDKTTWMRQVWHNIFNPDDGDLKDGYYFFSTANANTTGGGTAEYFTSGYIPVLGGKQYYFNAPTAHVKIFDGEKAYISTVTTSGGNIIEIPDGAVYMRFSIHKGKVTADAAQVYEYIGEVWEYDTYKNLYSIVVTDAGYSKAIADMIEGKFVDGSLAPADLFADESILYKQIKGWDEFHWNIVDPNSLEIGLLNNDGTEREIADTETDKRRRTKYVPVTAGETLHFLGFVLFLYDSEKNFISKLDQSSGKAVVPDGAAYIRAYNYANNGTIPGISIYRCGYGRNLIYNSVVSYDESIPRFTVPDVLEAYKCYLGIHPWADKNFGIIGDSFTAPGVWDSVMCANLKAASRWNHAISGANFADADDVPKTAYEQAQEMVTDGNTPDVILITMGTNDANNSRTIGDIVQSNSISDFDLTTYTGGMQACLNYLQNNFPNAIIYVGWTPMGGLVNGTKAEYITRMQEVCLMYGVEYIETRTCGVTRFSDVYAECYESGTNGGHPTGVGQQKIGAYMTRLMQSKM